MKHHFETHKRKITKNMWAEKENIESRKYNSHKNQACHLSKQG